MQTLPPGSLLGARYQVVEILGQGAMSVVYLVEDQRLRGARWALKELQSTHLPDTERASARALFQREGDILDRLSHPGLPRFIDRFNEGSDRHYLVMERIEGLPLDELLAQLHRPLTPAEALPIALQATHVLEHLHGQDPPVVFRDLKPSNLMIGPSGRVRFIDFGIARFFRSAQARDTQELGTPGFCAPEQYGQGQSTPRSDLYALGVTLFHLLTLQDPQDLRFQFPPLSQFQPVPARLEQAAARCLKLNPQERYPDAAELRADLEAALSELPPPSAGSTRALASPLLELAAHASRVPRPQGWGAWPFWRDWLLTTFHLRPASAPPSPP